MATDDVTIQAKNQPPLDHVLEHYYTCDDSMNKTKLFNIKKVMRSAMSITKSQTGEVILKTNRIEKAGLRFKNDIIRRERTLAEVENNKNKILFKAQYKKWMDYNVNKLPEDIQSVKDRYRDIRRDIKKRKLAKMFIQEPKWGTLPFNKIGEANTKAEAWVASNNTEGKTTYKYSYPKRQTVSRDNVSSQSQKRVQFWRENTFDMNALKELLTDQKLKQESMYYKMKIDHWRSQMIERQKTIAENFSFTRTSTFIRDPIPSASTDTDSRPLTRSALPSISLPASPRNKIIKSRKKEQRRRRNKDNDKKDNDLILKEKSVSFYA